MQETQSKILSSRTTPQKLVLYTFDIAILIAFLASINVCYFWNNNVLWMGGAAALVCFSMLISNICSLNLFQRNDHIISSTLCGLILLCYMTYTLGGGNFNAYILCFVKVLIFLGIFRCSLPTLKQLDDWICKVMAILCAVSYCAFLLHLFHISLPHKFDTFGTYNFTNYYFFLLDFKQISNVIPRFQAFFLEPGHLGTVCALLLASQKGHFRTWYNIILLIMLLVSFSLAAYVLLVLILILHLWVDHKKIFAKLLVLFISVGAVVIGSMLYNEGDNMLNELIISRLAINEEGTNIEGYNRTASWFDIEYNNYVQSGDILMGREMPKDEAGNAGHKVFFYEHGLIGIILLCIFYICTMCSAPYTRALVAMIVISACNFTIRAYPMQFAFYIPYYFIAFNLTPSDTND